MMFGRLRVTQSGSSFGICGPPHVVEAACFAGRIWYDAASPDGVAVRVAHRRLAQTTRLGQRLK
jgi:hypothetical protein